MKNKSVLTLIFLCIISFTINGCASHQVWEKVHHPPPDHQFSIIEATAKQIYLSGFTRDNNYRYGLAIPYKVQQDDKKKDNIFPPYDEGVVIITDFSRYTSVMPFLSLLLSYSDSNPVSVRILITDIVPLYGDEYLFEIDINVKETRNYLSKYVRDNLKTKFSTYWEDILYRPDNWTFHGKMNMNGVIKMPDCCRIQDNNHLYGSGYSEKEKEKILKNLPNAKLKISFHEKKNYLLENDNYLPLLKKPFEVSLVFSKESDYELYKNNSLTRILLTPFAFVFDVATFPIQFFISHIEWH